MRHTLKIAIMIGLTLPAVALHAKPPEALTLDASSPTALVVLKSVWWQPAPSLQSAFKLTLSAYDPVAEKLLGGPYGGGALFEAKKKNFADGYLIVPIKPGRWTFQSYAQQDMWALCFNASSWQFEVKPGEVLYLGELDATRHRRELLEQAVRTGRVSIRGNGFADFFDLTEGPHLAPIDALQLASVRDMLARRAPHVTAPLRAAVYSPAKFGTGSTLFAERRCGGYFATGAKDKSVKD
jgi:hypothetical protein